MTKENRAGAILYPEISDAETRISFRTGEIVITTAASDPIFRKSLQLGELTLDEVFPASDGLDLTLGAVCRRIQDVDGLGGVVRVLKLALDNIGEYCNGDQDFIDTDLQIALEQYRRFTTEERKQRKLSS